LDGVGGVLKRSMRSMRFSFAVSIPTYLHAHHII
jgi:hypothetical protein